MITYLQKEELIEIHKTSRDSGVVDVIRFHVLSRAPTVEKQMTHEITDERYHAKLRFMREKDVDFSRSTPLEAFAGFSFLDEEMARLISGVIQSEYYLQLEDHLPFVPAIALNLSAVFPNAVISFSREYVGQKFADKQLDDIPARRKYAVYITNSEVHAEGNTILANVLNIGGSRIYSDDLVEALYRKSSARKKQRSNLPQYVKDAAISELRTLLGNVDPVPFYKIPVSEEFTAPFKDLTKTSISTFRNKGSATKKIVVKPIRIRTNPLGFPYEMMAKGLLAYRRF